MYKFLLKRNLKKFEHISLLVDSFLLLETGFNVDPIN